VDNRLMGWGGNPQSGDSFVGLLKMWTQGAFVPQGKRGGYTWLELQ